MITSYFFLYDYSWLFATLLAEFSKQGNQNLHHLNILGTLLFANGVKIFLQQFAGGLKRT